MRTLRTIFIFLFAALSASTALAGNSRRGSSGDYLEYSLMGLKQSAQDTREQNKLLAQEINKIKSNSEALKQKIGEAIQNKKQLSVGYDQLRSQVGSHVQQLDLVKQQLLRLQKDAQQVAQEESRILLLYQAKEKQDRDAQARVASLEKDIVKFGESIQELEYVINDDYSNQVRNYRQSIKEAEQKIKMAQRELKRLENEFGKPTQGFDGLKRENDVLRQQLRTIAEDQARFTVEDELPSAYQAQADVSPQAPSKEVAGLIQRRRELEAILAKAKSKMDKADISRIQGSGTADLAQNLMAIQAENQALKAEYSSLAQRSGGPLAQ